MSRLNPALEAIIHGEERFTVAVGAADIGIKNRHPHFIEIVIVPRLKDRARLTFGTAVDIDEHRPLSGELFGVGCVEKSRKRQCRRSS